MTKMNSRGRHLHHPGHVISSFLQSQGCVLTTPFSVVGWDNLWASPWGQALHAGQALFIPQAQHVANFTHGPQVLHRTLSHKFLVASFHIPPSLPPSLSSPLWGKKTTISARGDVPQLLAGPACPQAPVSTASSVPPGFHRVTLLPSRPRGLWPACVHKEPSSPAACPPGPSGLCHPGRLSLEMTVVPFLELSFTAIFGWSHHVPF